MKEKILSEYFLVETEKTEEMKGWKVIGQIEGSSTVWSRIPLIELKTDEEGWLCDFKIKILQCGLVLVSPEYVIDEDELVMEAAEKVWKGWGVTEQIEKALQQEAWKELLVTQTQPLGDGDITWTASPYTSTLTYPWSNTTTGYCSQATNYVLTGTGTDISTASYSLT